MSSRLLSFMVGVKTTCLKASHAFSSFSYLTWAAQFHRGLLWTYCSFTYKLWEHVLSSTVPAPCGAVVGIPQAGNSWKREKRKSKVQKAHECCHLTKPYTKIVWDLRRKKKKSPGPGNMQKIIGYTCGGQRLESNVSSTACGSWLASCHSHRCGWAGAKPSACKLEMNCLWAMLWWSGQYRMGLLPGWCFCFYNN